VKLFARHLIAAGTCAVCICSPLPAHAANPRVKQIVVVFKTHFDIGYTAAFTPACLVSDTQEETKTMNH
jgi:hypothetical protein